jgi:hypothetical protein
MILVDLDSLLSFCTAVRAGTPGVCSTHQVMPLATLVVAMRDFRSCRHCLHRKGCSRSLMVSLLTLCLLQCSQQAADLERPGQTKHEVGTTAHTSTHRWTN